MRSHLSSALVCAAAWALSSSAWSAECPADAEHILCGVENAEDLVWLPDGERIIASSLGTEEGSGRISLVDPATGEVSPLYPGASPAARHNADWFADCSSPPDLTEFSPHGMALQSVDDNLMRLYVVAHGAREAVEVFEIDTDKEKPSATWTGCVAFPESDSINSVTALPDGGFYATRIAEQADTFDVSGAFTGDITGFLYGWQPDTGLTRIAGTDMSYPNGIVTSADGSRVYVASWGRQKIVRFIPGDTWTRDGEGDLDFRPDNLRWSSDGRILTAGQRMDESMACGQMFCFTSWSAASIDPLSLEATTIAEGVPAPGFLAATVAISAPKGYWLGTFVGDRLIYVPEGWRANQ